MNGLRQCIGVLGFWGVAVCGPAMAVAQTGADPVFRYNMNGVGGHIDMPNGLSADDGTLTTTFTYTPGTQKVALTFQATPRLSSTFRYSHIEKLFGTGTYDRSFDLRYQLLTETDTRPAVAIGLQDFIGTGIYSGEYIAATKHFGPLTGTLGLGWGRLGTYQPIGSTGSRPPGFTGTGGQVEAARWFQGNVAPFAGLDWAINDRLSVRAEYSSDAYLSEVNAGQFTRRSPFNFGLDYQFGRANHVSLYSIHGAEFGVMVSFATDLKSAPNGATRDGAPLPVVPRAAASAVDLGWVPQADAFSTAARPVLAQALAQTGITLEGMKLAPTRAELRITNTRFAAQAQAVGRTARIAAASLPASIETFDIVLMGQGMALSRTTVQRSDLEQLEHHPQAAQAMLARSQITDAADVARRADRDGLTPQRFTWSIGPYAEIALFDPTEPVRFDLGVEANIQWNPTPGLYVVGQVRQPVAGNLDTSTRFSDSVLPHVRSDGNFYDKDPGPVLEQLAAHYYFRPATDFYGRVSAGYLERQYGGVSAELLWKPVGSRLALGAEVNYAVQRSWTGLGFRPNTIDQVNAPGVIGPERSYDVVTGHVSAYYAFANGFHGQLDVGRYLAKDWGATVRLERVFDNGWRVGGYATFTDVSFDDFGEGSFDKGILITIPLDWQIGQPSRQTADITLQPLQRDGGARLNVDGRLYDIVRDAHQPALTDRWSRFWR